MISLAKEVLSDNCTVQTYKHTHALFGKQFQYNSMHAKAGCGNVPGLKNRSDFCWIGSNFQGLEVSYLIDLFLYRHDGIFGRGL